MIVDYSLIVTSRDSRIDPLPTLRALLSGPADRPMIFLVGNVSADFHCEGVTVFPSKTPSEGRNWALHQTSAEIVCFIDADCLPTPQWLQEITHPLADREIVGVKGVYATQQRGLIGRFVQVEYEEKYHRLRQQTAIDFVDTYSAAYRRETILANGGFDERFPFLEDQELSFRLASRGYQLRFQPSAIVYRQHPSSLRAYFRNKFAIGYWKAQVISRFPHQSIADSHTPQTIKAQIVLLGLGLFALLFGRRWLAPLTLLFGLTSLPLGRFAWRNDPLLALCTPVLVAVRALALGLGYSYGLVRPIPHIASSEATLGGFNFLLKRLLDLVGGAVGSLITALLFPFIAWAIKWEDGGEIFFRQTRIGQRGRPFTVYKFRSMRMSAEQELASLVDINTLEQPAFKLKDDPRVTKIGRFLRRWSLDELPQFYNVLIGDMSLIGPRPEETRLVARYNDYQRRRLAIKPGLSGPMQVSGRGDLPFAERIALEIAYIEQYSIWQDLLLLLHTIPAVISGKGAR